MDSGTGFVFKTIFKNKQSIVCLLSVDSLVSVTDSHVNIGLHNRSSLLASSYKQFGYCGHLAKLHILVSHCFCVYEVS